MKYFNQRLSYFVQNVQMLQIAFFERNILQNLKMHEQVNVVMRKISIPSLKAGIFNNTSFMEAVREHVKTDQVFTLYIYELNQRNSSILDEI